MTVKIAVSCLIAVLKNFGLNDVNNIYEISIGNGINKKYKVLTPNGIFFLKGIPYKKKAMVKKKSSHLFQKLILSNNIPVPHLLSNHLNKTFILINSYIWEVQEWIDGSRVVINQDSGFSVGFLLYKVHSVTKDIDKKNFISLDILENIKNHKNKVEHLGKKTYFPTHIEKSMIDLFENLENNFRFIKGGSLLTCVAHGDFHRGNVLFRSNKIVGLVDFDSTNVQPRVCELANSIFQFSLKKAKYNIDRILPAALQISIARSISRGYCQGILNNLNCDEIKSIPFFIRYHLLTECLHLLNINDSKNNIRQLEAAIGLYHWVDSRKHKICKLIEEN